MFNISKRLVQEFKQVIEEQPQLPEEEEENEEEGNSVPVSPEERKDLRATMMEFFRSNPNPSDDDIHNFAEKEGVSPDQLEEVIYSILTSFFAHGKFVESGKRIEDFDPEQIKMGIKVEMEHTDYPKIALRITLDHLTECPSYYTKLAEMEKTCE